MKIALVDDDEESAEKLERLLTDNLGDCAVIRRFNSGEEFIENFSAGDFDVVFLDIYMLALTGVQTARIIRNTDKRVKLVFCLTSNEFASESYEVNACYYLKKPFTLQSFSSMLARLDPDETGFDRVVRLPDSKIIRLRSIIYADYSSHRVVFHIKNEKNAVVRMSFADAQTLLCSHAYFCTVSKGVIINFYEIESRTRDVFIMSDGESIPISRRRYKDVLNSYAQFRFHILRQED